MNLVGKFLIPVGNYLYSLRVDWCEPWEPGEWDRKVNWPYGYFSCVCTRFDLDRVKRVPVLRWPDRMHVHRVRWAAAGVVRDREPQGFREDGPPMYFRIFEMPGQVEMNFELNGSIAV